jgi:hypothetical protein
MEAKLSEQMHYGRRTVNWRELHDVALEAHDPKALKHEEHVRHDSSEISRANKSFNRWLDGLSALLDFSSDNPGAVFLLQAFAISRESF